MAMNNCRRKKPADGTRLHTQVHCTYTVSERENEVKMSASRPWMIYGAYGYTGALIARKAAATGWPVLLAGRREEALSKLAGALNLPWRCLALEDTGKLVKTLEECGGVLHCAGPFKRTAKPMIEACIAAHRPYLDITGEIEAFEFAHDLDFMARSAGIPLCPGVGFDIVPTDCVASVLKSALPAARKLTLGFDGGKHISPGTARTMAAGMGDGGFIRRNGSLVRVPLGWDTRRIDFGAGEKQAITIPWGDVATAYYSTGIGNIRVYIPASTKTVRRMRRLNAVRPLLGIGPVRRFLENRAAASTRGPDDEELASTRVHVWGEACTGDEACITATLETPNGYALTRDSALMAMQRLDSQPPDQSGYFTPSQLFGQRFVESLPGVGAIEVHTPRSSS